MVIAIILYVCRACTLAEGVMKKVFFTLALNVILIGPLCAGLVSAEEKPKKEKVQVVVVEKKNKDKSGSNGESKKPRREDQGLL
jgi:hypothetical protein